MRSLKPRGGLIRGKGMAENIVLTYWVHDACLRFDTQCSDSINWNTHKTSNQHAELGKSRINLGDADTQIISAALEYAKDGNKDVVVVAAADPDILVLLMFHMNSGKASSLKKFEKPHVFQKFAEVFEDEISTAEEIEKK
ncbi:unnamed protein product [Lepeophtheirus salmonis]|uniref:(salmon louse) hypothetical protein n=1 Tax=Lepeophtheirus salmonis TaxID=72036 RepID=A0A7R8CI74_LEPSM|nr:unnamed protein product [Lepeophtheirus salmonis]CAF2797820.1 unnamed protein product [Lepeophtheirus salmonis]